MNRVVENYLSSFKFAKSTKDSYRRILNELITIPNLDQLDAAGLIDFINKPGWGNSQQNVAIFCAQKFLRWKYGSLHPALAATIPRIKPKPRRSLNPDQTLEVLASFNPYKAIGAREIALIAFGLDTGFRRAEIASMQLADVDFYTNTATTLCKGGQYKYGAFTEETAQLLRNWLQVRKPADGTGNLFTSMKTGKGLTSNGVGTIFKRLSKSIGFQISAHDLRSSFATQSTANGAPSRLVQKAGRWSSIEMVEHYTGRLQLDPIKPYLPMANLKKF